MTFKDKGKKEGDASSSPPAVEAGESKPVGNSASVAAAAPAAGIPLFQDPMQRIVLTGGVGPGFQQSCFQGRNYKRIGIIYVGEMTGYSAIDTEGTPLAYNPWFSYKPAGAYNQLQWAHPILMDLSYDYSKLGKISDSPDNENPGFVHSIHSFNAKFICKHWAQAENVSTDLIQLCEGAFLTREFLYPLACGLAMNQWKKGTSLMKNLMLASLPASGYDIPTISTFSRTISEYFDASPGAWHWTRGIEFARARSAMVAMTPYDEDGLIVPIGNQLPALMWRQITGQTGTYGGSPYPYCDPITALSKVPGALEFYLETYLPLRTGLDPAVDHMKEFVVPGAMYRAMSEWFGAGQFPIIVSPASFQLRLNEFRFDDRSSQSYAKVTRFKVTAGNGYPEIATSADYDELGAYNRSYEKWKVTPASTSVRDHRDVLGRRIICWKPELFLAPGGMFNRVILDWMAHQTSKWIGATPPVVFEADIPMFVREWLTSSTYTAMENDALTDWLDWSMESGDPMADLLRDILRIITNNPLGLDSIRGQPIRHPNFLEAFPNAVLINDPAYIGTATSKPQVPSKQKDLVASLVSWMDLAHFVTNERKTGKWLNAESGT